MKKDTTLNVHSLPTLIFRSRKREASIFLSRTGETFHAGKVNRDKLSHMADNNIVIKEHELQTLIVDHDFGPKMTPSPPRQKSLCILVTSKCNHYCAYCLASQGSFGRDENDLPPAEFLRVIERWLKDNRDVRTIKLFGGEPLLEPELLSEICEASCKHSDEKPFIGMTTNGTVGKAEKHIALLQKYRINLAISVDGPKEIHDASRILKGSSSHEKAIQYCADLRELGFPFATIAVYDERHLKAGIGYLDLVRYLGDLAPIRKIQFVTNMGYASDKQEWNLAQFREDILRDVDAMFEIITNGCSSEDWKPVYENNFARILSSLVMGESAYPAALCTAENLTSIFRDGRSTSCYMFDTPPTKEKLLWGTHIAAGRSAPWYAGLVTDVCAKEFLSTDNLKTFSQVATETIAFGLLRNIADVTPGTREHLALIGFVQMHRSLTGLRKQPGSFNGG